MEVHTPLEQTLVQILEEAVISFCQKYFCQSVALEVDGIVCVTEPVNRVDHVVKLHKKLGNSKTKKRETVLASKHQFVEGGRHLHRNSGQGQQTFSSHVPAIQVNPCVTSVENSKTDNSNRQASERSFHCESLRSPGEEINFIVPECNVKTEPTFSTSTCNDIWIRDKDENKRLVGTDNVEISIDGENEVTMHRHDESIILDSTQLMPEVENNRVKNDLTQGEDYTNLQHSDSSFDVNSKDVLAGNTTLLDKIPNSCNAFPENLPNKQPNIGMLDHKPGGVQRKIELDRNEMILTNCDLRRVSTSGLLENTADTWQVYSHGIPNDDFEEEQETNVKLEDFVNASEESDMPVIQNRSLWTEFHRPQINTALSCFVGNYSTPTETCVINFDNNEETQCQKRYACKYNCGMTFTRIWTRTRHETTRCPNAKSYTVYKCRLCTCQSRRRDDMHKHIRLHHQLSHLDQISEYIQSFETLVNE